MASARTLEPWLVQLQPFIRWLTALAFIFVGVLHFTHAEIFALIVPPWLPAPMWLVWISGVCEVLGGVGLVVPRTQRLATWGLLALVAAVFPANIYMATEGIVLPVDGLPQSELGRWLRLPWQGVIALQVWFSGLWRPRSRR